MTSTIIIQARTGSKRFPKKVLAKIEHKPMIQHIIERTKFTNAKQIILCTTKKNEDKILVEIAEKTGIKSFTGSTNDVLERFYFCAKKFNADPIIRITGDCPLVDPKLIDEMLKLFKKSKYDYLTNTIIPTYPDGLDIEIFTFKTLENTFKNAKLKSEREHVTPYIKNHPQDFKIKNFVNDKDLSSLRLTVDEKDDLKLIRKIYSLIGNKKNFLLDDIEKLVLKYPELVIINKRFHRNEGYFRSLKKDSM